MARRKKKGEPEMLIVSFCDIVTITTAAMFFAMLITVQEAVKIPVIRKTPVSKPTSKEPVFYECRSNELYALELGPLQDQVLQMLPDTGPNARPGDLESFLRTSVTRQITNRYYRVNPTYLLTAILALEPKTDTVGIGPDKIEKPGGEFVQSLHRLQPKTQYTVFLVRDDSFPVFRLARKTADKMGFEVGWEYLDRDEPIKFGAGGTRIGSM